MGLVDKIRNTRKHYAPLILPNYTTTEMLALTNIERGAVIFNTDIQNIVTFRKEGWCSPDGTIIGNVVFSEYFTDDDLPSNGNTDPTTGWVFVQDTRDNHFIVTSECVVPLDGNYLSLAYDTDDCVFRADATNVFHMYRDITLPDKDIIKIFTYLNGIGIQDYAYGTITLASTDTSIAIGTEVTGTVYILPTGLHQWTFHEIDISAARNTTKRLVISWRSKNAYDITPVFSMDNLLIISN